MHPISRPCISHPTKSSISRGPRVCGPRSPIDEWSLRSSAQAHDLGHLANESLAANRNQSSKRMDTVNLGRSGLRVSRLCLGTMIFGSQLDEAAAFAVMDRAVEVGIDFFDTADVYPVPPSPETR